MPNRLNSNEMTEIANSRSLKEAKERAEARGVELPDNYLRDAETVITNQALIIEGNTRLVLIQRFIDILADSEHIEHAIEAYRKTINNEINLYAEQVGTQAAMNAFSSGRSAQIESSGIVGREIVGLAVCQSERQ